VCNWFWSCKLALAAGSIHRFLSDQCIIAAALQKRDLRNYAALAAELGARLVLTGLFRHYMDLGSGARQHYLEEQKPEEALMPSCFPDSSKGYMPFTTVLDRCACTSMGAVKVESAMGSVA
jgi:hypothetical protein